MLLRRLNAVALALGLIAALAPISTLAQNAPATDAVQTAPQGAPQQARPDVPGITEFKLRSACVSAFWKKDRFIEAGVVEPLDRKKGEELPVVYNVHGFGGSHEVAWFEGPNLQKAMQSGASPRMLYVFLNAQFEWGHHEFADSACNGPWGQALTREFIPALEKKFNAVGDPTGRFLTGHSSGGWSTLWLQVTYPDYFGGCWSTAPDSVDFRDFTGIDIYSYENAYTDPEGRTIMLERRKGEFVKSIQQYVNDERRSEPVGGQFFSFNAVFGEKGADGLPKQLFDWKTGAIDSAVADSWRPYDIALTIRNNWKTLGPKISGKVHIYVGTQDTYRLEGALELLRDDLKAFGVTQDKIQILFVEGRDHGTLFQPEATLWPKGMMERIHREMFGAYQKTHPAPAPPAK